ncbi:chitinase [bacterium A37T11]|nr:chitinase [bacterium A37T11]
MKTRSIYLLFFIGVWSTGFAQKTKKIDVIAYYTGDQQEIDHYAVSKLSHIIFSFCHLKDGKLYVSNARDTATIQHLVSLKKQYPTLKIMLSLGGWSGCEPCSEAFSTLKGRALFARSVKEVNDYFGTDGIDLDWEYPAIEGYPGHLYQLSDRENFTALIQELRKVLGKGTEISFAAGGFQKFLDQSIEWKKVMPLVDRVNIMSYDLVNGYSKVTGHHTPLYSVRAEEESTDRAVEYLLKLGIPAKKLVIGAAFYTRVWKNVDSVDNGRYRAGEPTSGYDFKNYTDGLSKTNGWAYYYDEKAQAPYWYNEAAQTYATGDDLRSVHAKTAYAIKKGLGGIMFWELTLDSYKGGMLDVMDDVINGR